MAIEVGRKIKCGVVEAVSADEKLVAIYSQFDLGNKGRIYAKNFSNQRDYLGKVPTIQIGGVGYHLVECCADYPELMRKFQWYMTDKASAYSRREM